jgi:hypothetical protein
MCHFLLEGVRRAVPFKQALEAGATVKELSYILALTMREAAGADDC